MNIMILKRTALWGRSKWSPFRSFPILLILVAILSLSQIAASQNVNNENVAIQSIDDLNQSTKHESSVLVNPNESQSIVRKVSEREIDASFASEHLDTNRRPDSTESAPVQPISNGNSDSVSSSLVTNESQSNSSQIVSSLSSPSSSISSSDSERPIVAQSPSSILPSLTSSTSSPSNTTDTSNSSQADVASSDDSTNQFTHSSKEAGQNVAKDVSCSNTDAGLTDTLLPPSCEPQDTASAMMRKDDESLPSFDEWKKRVLEEEQPSIGVQPQIDPGHIIMAVTGNQFNKDDKIRIRNYASAECGSKVLSSNNEAEGSWKMLQESSDEYMLNPCSADIWFIVELCEPIQLVSIQVANYELFSSTFKHFSVYTAAHYPSSEWQLVANLQASDTKSVQLFPLPRQTEFRKFVKLQVINHHGNEHYCPFSLIRVFGVSMVEEFDALEQKPAHFVHPSTFYSSDHLPVANHAHPIPPITNSNHPTYFEKADVDETKVKSNEPKSNSLLVPSSLLGTARDAVLSVVRKAALMFHKYSVRSEKTDLSNVDNNVAILLKDEETVEAIIEQWVMKMLPVLGAHLDHCPSSSKRRRCQTTMHCSYLRYMLGTKTFDLLRKELRKPHDIRFKCDKVISVIEKDDQKRLPASIESKLAQKTDSVSIKRPADVTDNQTPTTDTILSHNHSLPVAKLSSPPTVQIKPSTATVIISAFTTSLAATPDSSSTPALDVFEPKNTPQVDHLPSTVDVTRPVSLSFELPTASFSAAPLELNTVLPPDVDHQSDGLGGDVLSNGSNQIKAHNQPDSAAGPSNAEHSKQMTNGQHNGNGNNAPDTNHALPSPLNANNHLHQHSPISGPLSKESVFVRMSNKIRALELNLSLSSQYLEELSQRYRRQMDEMQRNFNQTVFRLNEAARLAAEKDNRQQLLLDRLGHRIQQLEFGLYLLVFLILSRLVIARFAN